MGEDGYCGLCGEIVDAWRGGFHLERVMLCEVR